MMSKKPTYFPKLESIKRYHPSVKPSIINLITLPSSPRIISAQRVIQKSRSSLPSLSKQSKCLSARVVTFPIENIPSPIKYHPWESKYNQTFIREKIQKTMTKDTYIQTTPLITQANESITTEEECSPVLISPDNIQIEKPIIHKPKKSILPNIIRYVRNNDIISSELFLQKIPIKKSSVYQLQIETLPSFPMINTKTITSNLIKTDHLLNRNKTSMISTMDTIYEEIDEYCISDRCYTTILAV